MMFTDRVTGTSFFVAAQGGTGWLWENVFWIMGHPEVYVILIPPVAAMLEVASTFARKPLFGYKVTIGAFVAIIALSIMVWAHHMFTTGWAPDLNGPFMLTTELISIPTGIIFLCVIGTLWRGSIWTRLPMYWVYLFLWNFIIGGVTGIYLSDVPADNYFHGDMFVTAHFHYTLLGGAMIAAMAALCYWFPKVSRSHAERAHRQGRLLDGRHRHPDHVLRHVLGGLRGHAAARRLLRPDLPARQPDGHRRRLPAHGRVRGAALRHRPQLGARQGRPGQPLARQDPGVDGAHPGAAGELPGRSGRHRRPLRLRRARARARANPPTEPAREPPSAPAPPRRTAGEPA